MNAATFQLITIGCFVLAAVLFVIVVILFFVQKIPAVIGIVSGRAKEKQIQSIRKQTSEKKHNGKLDLLQAGKNTIRPNAVQQADLKTEVLDDGQATEVLSSGMETLVLDPERQNSKKSFQMLDSQIITHK